MDRVYLETSVWGMVPPGQNAALRQPTLEFLDRCERQLFIACISDVVANEIRQAPEKAQEAILQRMALINPVLLPIPRKQMLWHSVSLMRASCRRVAWMLLVTLPVLWSMKWNFW